VTSAEFYGRLVERSEAAGLTVPAEIASKLHAYYQLLCTWNRRINLTALDLDRLPSDAMDRLMIEPLAAARFARTNIPVLDVGSGGGSPAIPLALACDASELVMVESRTRKSTFLREAAHAVGLLRASVLTGRFEDVSGSDDLRGRFDVVSLRAVRVTDKDWPRLARLLSATGKVLLIHRLGLGLKTGRGFGKAGTHQLTENAELSIFEQRLGSS